MSIGVKVGGIAVNFALTLVLARALGAEGYGVYAFIFSLIMLLATPAQVGLPALVVRETAKAHAKGAWALMRGLWRWSNVFVACFSLSIAIIGALALWFGQGWSSEERWNTLAAGLALVPLLALANVQAAALQGLRHAFLGQLPESIIRPGLLLMLTVFFIWWRSGGVLTAAHVMALHGVAACGALVLAIALLRYVRPLEVQAAPVPKYEHTYWRRAMIPLAFLAGLQLINAHTDIIMLGLIYSNEEAGVYRVVVQIATFAIFGLQAVNQWLQPQFARLYAKGSLQRLQELVTYSARIILVLALLPVIPMVIFGEPLLGFLFGVEYRTGALALAILAIAQLVNAAMGSVGMLLKMTGHERETVRGVAIAAATNVVLNIVLIAPFGQEGAAAATGISLAIWNIILRRSVYNQLGIESAAFTLSAGTRN